MNNYTTYCLRRTKKITNLTTFKIIVLLLLSTSTIALPSFSKEFNSLSKVRKEGRVEKASCSLCHIGKTIKLNMFGKDLSMVMKEAKSKKITEDILSKVMCLDSDKDGATNSNEIKSDTLPGDSSDK